MKKILLFTFIILGFSAITVSASSWSKVFSTNTDLGELQVFSVYDTDNVCYVSVLKESTSISCLKNVSGEIMGTNYSPINKPLVK